MKIRIVKVIKWYEWEYSNITYDVREVRVKNITGHAVKDMTIFHGNTPVVNDSGLYKIFQAALILHEGM